MGACNIDAKGKRVRLIWGGLCLAAAVALSILTSLGVLTGWGWWIAASVSAALGALGIWESRRGWCVVRAMGFKTPV
jgi:hypothetical protein